MTTATPRRVAPTARLILPAGTDRHTWLAARRAGIGSSDVPEILGIYPSPLRVWYDKRGELPDTDTEPKRWGRVLEDPVAREWCRRNGSVIRRVGLIANTDQPWATCTLDRQVVECPLGDGTARNVCALEVKSRAVWGAAKWRRAVPDDVLAQTLWQMRVTGYDHIHVACLIGGNDYRQTIVWANREEQTATYVRAVVDAFHHDHMPAADKPGPPATDDAALWDELHTNRSGIRELDLEEWATATDLIQQYAAAHAQLAEPAARKREAKAGLLELLGDAEVAVAGGDKVYSYLERPGRPRVDLDLLAERWPDAYEACVAETTVRAIDTGMRRRGGA